MIPRVIVPTNARISPTQSNGPNAVRQDLLVPRNLIPANARISEAPESADAVDSSHEAAPSRRLMVPKLLVPPGARIAAEQAGLADAVVSPRGDVFDEAILGDSSLGHRRSAGEWLISLAVHAAIVVTVLIVPLFYTQVIDLQRFETTYLAAPQMPAAPLPPPPPAAAVPRQAQRKTLPTTAKLTMPIAVPKTVPVPLASAEEAAPDIIAGVPGGVLGGVPGGQIGGVLGGIIGGTAPSLPAPPPVAAAPVAPSGPLHVGGEVKPPRAIYKPAPEYPRLALQTRIQGDVEIDAVIDKDGNVIQARAMSGPPMLIGAALKAVAGWKYEPTYLNGQPYPIELTVHVTFSLS